MWENKFYIETNMYLPIYTNCAAVVIFIFYNLLCNYVIYIYTLPT